ncbi:Hypothetical predicted protein [Mytilus galloprovincialis]|uniref:Uncharacterized protein n=1 Tax=Mytilus galloprovincialis TaxID=29158 RepID=A0A8B6ECE2_MYTGA|nr:Hypothetical predicted protein [Mytilus galloprovincialis]
MSAQDFTLQSYIQLNNKIQPIKQLDQKPAGKDDSVTDKDDVSNFECRTCAMSGLTTKRKYVLSKHMHMQGRHDVKKRAQKEDDLQQPPSKRQRTDGIDQPSEERLREKRYITTAVLNDGVDNIRLQPSNNEERYDLMLFFKENQVDFVQI